LCVIGIVIDLRNADGRHVELLGLCDIVACFVLHKDLGHTKGRNSSHACRPLALDCATEAARPVKGIKEADDDIAIDSLFHTL
jgi:hypothetical protein